MQNRFLIGVGILLVLLSVIGLRMVNDFLEGEDILPRFFFSQVSPGPNEALYFVSPSIGTHNVNDTFQVELRVGASNGITSIKAYLDYDPSLIAVVSMVTSTSAFTTWWEDTFDNSTGQLHFQASAPSPGFSGSNGLIATITFQVMGAGTANLTYDVTSLALITNDTNILNIAGSTAGRYTLVVPDTTPPSRSAGFPTGTLPAGTTSTTVSLATDENATCKYATTSGVAFASMPNTFSSTGGTAHTTTVSGLSDGSTFSYFVRCRDSVGNVNTTDALIEFSVEETPDTTPPVRSNGQPTSTLPTGTSQTAISLATDENATCKYATISGVTFASMANTFSTTGGTSHSAQVSGLSNGNTFSYFVRCRDGSSNANTNDFLIQFSVDSPLPPPDTTPPSRSSGQPVGPLSSGTTATSISLATDESATCKYATSVGVSYDSMANTFSSTGGISHSASVAGLSDGSAFSYYVRCKDSLNNKNTDDFLIEFSVAQAADTTPPSRSAGFPTGTLPAGTTSTTVSLATDENATCKYATTSGVAFASMPNTFSSTGGTAHTTTVSGFSNGSTLSYFARCQDAAGNMNTTDFLIEFSIETPPAPPPPPSGGGGASSGGGGGGGASGALNVRSAGDCNNDRKVNIFDLSILLSNWQKVTSTCDSNGDGVINIFDLSVMLSNWAP